MNRNTLILLALILALGGAAIGMYMYNMEPEKAGEQSAAFSLSAPELIEAFVENESEAQARYLNQVLEVQGEVKEFSETPAGIVAILSAGEGTINCAFEADQTAEIKNNGFKVGDAITIKGFCDGYGDLFVEVSLSRCVWVKP